MQAEDYTYTTNNGTITITGYTGAGGAVTIPDMIHGLPVTSIGRSAFALRTSLMSVVIGHSVTNIGSSAFADCTSLTNVVIGSSVTSIGRWAFAGCDSLTSLTIPSSVTSIGSFAFAGCTNLTGVFFQGNAPSLPGPFIVFDRTSGAVVYYLPGTMGWEPTFDVLPTALWLLPNPLILNSGPSFGVQTNRFGLIISWATNRSVVVEASTDLANPIWSPVATNMLTGGSSYFSDPEWTNYPARSYRLRSP